MEKVIRLFMLMVIFLGIPLIACKNTAAVSGSTNASAKSAATAAVDYSKTEN